MNTNKNRYYERIKEILASEKEEQRDDFDSAIKEILIRKGLDDPDFPEYIDKV